MLASYSSWTTISCDLMGDLGATSSLVVVENDDDISSSIVGRMMMGDEDRRSCLVGTNGC